MGVIVVTIYLKLDICCRA